MASTAVSSETSTKKFNLDVVAARGTEITGLSIYKDTNEDISLERAQELMSEMNADVPQGGRDIVFGQKETQRLRFWEPTSNSRNAPVVVFVHGGSWTIGTYLDSVGSLKVKYLNDLGYAFASIDYALIPSVTVKEQVQEVADASVVLMGHSSGAHVVSLIGTDPSYAQKAGFHISSLQGVIALDGSNYNAAASIADNTGSIVTNMLHGLGSDPETLDAMSPTLNAEGPNARGFLLLHVQRKGDIRQAVEFSAALKARGTRVNLHVFEGEGFEGHVALVLRIGDEEYPATVVMKKWLKKYVPV
ncbi:hypothetical protein FCULG_00012341 [Fusarium culmorum]|uniref:BD-FAE-like domain-containing protein n=1 Tax=Fusarium culmorum TaxID=5516 RepID=A0A2T4GRH2_FUSCU|nr:hypothetical protein FCULG_00012341 [Fusarium culmorum]